jgi:hypothetical protein
MAVMFPSSASYQQEVINKSTKRSQFTFSTPEAVHKFLEPQLEKFSRSFARLPNCEETGQPLFSMGTQNF